MLSGLGLGTCQRGSCTGSIAVGRVPGGPRSTRRGLEVIHGCARDDYVAVGVGGVGPRGGWSTSCSAATLSGLEVIQGCARDD